MGDFAFFASSLGRRWDGKDGKDLFFTHMKEDSGSAVGDFKLDEYGRGVFHGDAFDNLGNFILIIGKKTKINYYSVLLKNEEEWNSGKYTTYRIFGDGLSDIVFNEEDMVVGDNNEKKGK